MQTCDVELQSFHGRVNVAGCATAAGFFAEHVPWFEGLADIDVDSGCLELSDAWAAEFEMRGEPLVIECVA